MVYNKLWILNITHLFKNTEVGKFQLLYFNQITTLSDIYVNINILLGTHHVCEYTCSLGMHFAVISKMFTQQINQIKENIFLFFFFIESFESMKWTKTTEKNYLFKKFIKNL